MALSDSVMGLDDPSLQSVLDSTFKRISNPSLSLSVQVRTMDQATVLPFGSCNSHWRGLPLFSLVPLPIIVCHAADKGTTFKVTWHHVLILQWPPMCLGQLQIVIVTLKAQQDLPLGYFSPYLRPLSHLLIKFQLHWLTLAFLNSARSFLPQGLRECHFPS